MVFEKGQDRKQIRSQEEHMNCRASRVRPSKLNAVAAMWCPLNPASSSCSFGDACSIYLSGKTIGRHWNTKNISQSCGHKKQKSSHTLQTSYAKAVCDYKCTKHNIKSLDHL